MNQFEMRVPLHLVEQMLSVVTENALVYQSILAIHTSAVVPSVSLILNAQEIKRVLIKNALILVQECVHKMHYAM